MKMRAKRIKRRYIFFGTAILIFIVGLIFPQRLIIPVYEATPADWNPESFWYYPWGTSGTHKGIDIFAEEGTDVIAPTNGIIISTGYTPKGGNYILMLGPKWRMHYFAHLKTIRKKNFTILRRGEFIATVGATGNAAGKPPHLHYSLSTLIPYFGRIDQSVQGYKKVFYLNPQDYFLRE